MFHLYILIKVQDKLVHSQTRDTSGHSHA